MQLGAKLFYSKKDTGTVIPSQHYVSDDEDLSDDDDVADPDFSPPCHDPGPSDIAGPSPKRKCTRPAVEVLDDDDDSDDDRTAPLIKTATMTSKKKTARPTIWNKVDISNTPLPTYTHPISGCIETPYQYFKRYFSPQLIREITYQTNLYATQKDVNTSFTTCDDEVMNFIAILIFMGICKVPAVEDYWAMETRIAQIANLMSSKRFRLMKRTIHFNDNTQIPGTVDRFFKIRPIFTSLNRIFRSELQTQKQSVDEVMVAYKGKTAGNLRQYIKNKPDKWGFKLFARASEDGFIHDMILYQGKTTLQAHGLPLSPEQEAMGSTSQIVSVLASTMSSSTTTAIFADNFFTCLELVRYLKEVNCRYTGTARDNRIGKPPLKPIKELEKKTVPRGTTDYVSSDDGILVVRWKDNKVVTLLSTDMGVEPVSSVFRYSSETKRKEEVTCPAVIKSYNANMGGIDKNNMLVHLYRTPMKSKRWYLRLFAYAIDVSLTNAWIMYKRDCKAIGEKSMPFKHFKIQVFRSAAGSRPMSLRKPEPLSNGLDMPRPVRGHRAITPGNSVRFDRTLFHGPKYAERQTCKSCSHKGHIYRSNIVCMVCKVHLCLNGARNCFIKYHNP